MLKTACIRQLGFLLSFSGTAAVIRMAAANKMTAADTAANKERQNKLCVE